SMPLHFLKPDPILSMSVPTEALPFLPTGVVHSMSFRITLRLHNPMGLRSTKLLMTLHIPAIRIMVLLSAAEPAIGARFPEAMAAQSLSMRKITVVYILFVLPHLL